MQFKIILFNNYLVDKSTIILFPYKFKCIRMERNHPEIVILPNCRFCFVLFFFLQLALLSLFIRSASRGLHALFIYLFFLSRYSFNGWLSRQLRRPPNEIAQRQTHEFATQNFVPSSFLQYLGYVIILKTF